MNDDLIEFCKQYDIPLQHLGEILQDPKVIPMIRGKAFEFSVHDVLTQILNNNIWSITKPYLNPQLNNHDQDVLITHLPTGKEITIECKLSAKGKYSYKDNIATFRIKCMRSRTLGEKQVKLLSDSRGVSEKQLSIHNDQYLPSDFDLVITSLANAFYSTDSNGVFVWNPSAAGKLFLNKKFGTGLSDNEYRNKAFMDIYVSKSTDLVVMEDNQNNVVCTRKACQDINNCGFIPNYPLLKFDGEDLTQPSNKWVHISQIETLLKDFLI